MGKISENLIKKIISIPLYHQFANGSSTAFTGFGNSVESGYDAKLEVSLLFL